MNPTALIKGCIAGALISHYCFASSAEATCLSVALWSGLGLAIDIINTIREHRAHKAKVAELTAWAKSQGAPL